MTPELKVLVANYEIKHKKGYSKICQAVQFERVCYGSFTDILDATLKYGSTLNINKALNP